MRKFIVFMGVAVLWAGGCARAPAAPPNILLIVCDDLGYGDVAGFGFKAARVATPELEKMAAEGAKLTRFMVTMPYCAPSRASFLTGQYPFRHGVVGNPAPDNGLNDYGLKPGAATLAGGLKKAGYDTYLVGKWHLGHTRERLPTRCGFDHYYGIPYSNDMAPVQILEDEAVAEYPVVQATLTRRYTDKALEYVKHSVGGGRPFFVMLAHAMPHKPLAASEAFYTPETPEDLYGDVMRELDASVGRLLREVEALGIGKNTLVLFTSDNGPYYGGDTGGVRGKKADTWDGGLRVPFLARWPGKVPAGVVNKSLVSSIDLYPTLLKLAGAEVSLEGVDGRDCWANWTRADASSPHEYWVAMKGPRVMAVYSGPWKLHVGAPSMYREPDEAAIHHKDRRRPDGVTIIAPYEQYTDRDYPGLKTGDAPREMMLFNIEEDPGEQHDVSGKRPEGVERLGAWYREFAPQVPAVAMPELRGYSRPTGGRVEFWKEE